MQTPVDLAAVLDAPQHAQFRRCVRERRWRAAAALLHPVMEACQDPRRQQLLILLGTLHKFAGDPDTAANYFVQAEHEGPAQAAALSVHATLLSELGRHQDALARFEASLRLDPDMPEVHQGRAEALLACGDYARGWPAFESRWQTRWRGPEPASFIERHRPPSFPALAGKRLLVLHELGFGDFLMFARYLPLLAAQAARVYVSVPPPLQRLLQIAFPACEVLDDAKPAPAFDYVCPVMGLPGLCGTTVDTVPQDFPYLRADPEEVNAWQRTLGATRRPRLGLTWAGNPQRSLERYPLRARSVPLPLLEPLLGGDWDVHILQPDLGDRDRDYLQRFPAVQHHGPQLVDFAATAALLECMDLVVSVDTAVAHLSLALGRPTAVLLPTGADYRWSELAGPGRSPWYPQAALYRRAADERWQAPIGRLLHDLQAGAWHGWQPVRPPQRIRVEYRARPAAQPGSADDFNKPKQENQMAQKITINGKEYELESLNDVARNQIMNLRVADSRINQLEQDLALAKTARAAYASILSRELPKENA